MPFQWKHRGETFIADTPEELAKIRALVKQQDADDERKLARLRFDLKYGNKYDALIELDALEAQIPWTPDTFISFIDRLGTTQQEALAALLSRQHMTDEELRKVVHVSDNQALAGVLSGISKQAAALDIPARAIFRFENFRNAGKRRSTYSVSKKFSQIATDMNWPPSSLQE